MAAALKHPDAAWQKGTPTARCRAVGVRGRQSSAVSGSDNKGLRGFQHAETYRGAEPSVALPPAIF